MRQLLLIAALTFMTYSAAVAGTMGVSLAGPNSAIMVLRQGIEKAAGDSGQPLQIRIAEADAALQLSHVQSFIAAKVDAIIVNPVDTSATAPMTNLANAAGIPIVYVNRQPIDVDGLGPKGAYVGSNEADASALQTKEVCRLLGGKGSVLMITGDPADASDIARSKAIHEVIATPECSGMNILDEQPAMGDPAKSRDLMTDWIAAGHKPAAVIASNDAMAIGAIDAMKAAGWDLQTVIVAGVDGTHEALGLVKTGDLDVTVFQDIKAQGSGAVDAALKLALGQKVDAKVLIPYQLVTPANVDQFTTSN